MTNLTKGGGLLRDVYMEEELLKNNMVLHQPFPKKKVAFFLVFCYFLWNAFLSNTTKIQKINQNRNNLSTHSFSTTQQSDSSF